MIKTRDRLVSDQANAGIKERLTFCCCWHLPSLNSFSNCSHAKTSHIKRILLRCGTNYASCNICNTGATAINRNNNDVVLAANSFQCLIGTSSGRLVDGIDNIDTRIDGQEILHALPAALGVAVRQLVTNDTRIAFIAPLRRITNVDAKAGQEALVAQNANSWLGHVDVQQANFCPGSITHRLGRPCANQLTSKKIVSCKCHVSRVDWVQRCVERQHYKTSVTSHFHGRGDCLGI